MSRMSIRASAPPVVLACVLAGMSSNGCAQPSPPPYNFLRYDEDYSYLRDPARRSDPWDAIKYRPLGSPDIYLSLGGEIRERFESYSAPNFGVPGPSADGYLLHRLLLHADVHAGDYLRAFVQLGNHLAPGKEVAIPPYEDRLDVQQAFVDVHVPKAGSTMDTALLRVGRQEMAFGAQRLVSVRDAPNVRRAFDGVRVGGATNSGVKIDAFATRPVLLKAGDFDDRPNQSQAFWGVYSTFPKTFVPSSGIDVYYLGFENNHALYSIGTGVERRHSVGGRVFGTHGQWDWDWEALGQFGSFGAQDLLAWGFSTDTGYGFSVADWKARAGIKATIGSGDTNPRDGKLGTYGGLFPKLAYFNQAGLLGASNVMDLQPSLTLKPIPRLKLTLSWDFIWRQTTNDAVYTSVATPIPGTAGRAGRYTGSQLAFDVYWQVDRHIVMNAGLVHVDVAKVLSAVGGHNTNFVYLSAAYTF